MSDQPSAAPPKVERTYGSPSPTEGRCAAKLRLSNPPRYCLQLPLPGRTRCKYHGGRSPRGVASPHFKNGRYTVVMPDRMRAAFEAALADPHITSLTNEIAAHRATAADLRRRLIDAPPAGAEAQRTWDAVKRAQQGGNPTALAVALTRHDAAMAAERAERELLADLRREDELVSKLTRAENDYRDQLDQQLSREQALVFIRGLSIANKEVIETYVADPGLRTLLLRAIGARFAELADRRGIADPESAGRRRLGPAVLDSAPVD